MDGETQEGHDGPYGFGPVRTLTEYEKYAGILFSKRAIDKYTLDKNYPPNPYNFETEQEWKDSFCMMFKHCIDIGYSQATQAFCKWPAGRGQFLNVQSPHSPSC